MLKKITWELVVPFVLLFGLGLVAIITVAIKHETAPNGEYAPALALGCGLIAGAIFLLCSVLFSKQKGSSPTSEK